MAVRRYGWRNFFRFGKAVAGALQVKAKDGGGRIARLEAGALAGRACQTSLYLVCSNGQLAGARIFLASWQAVEGLRR